MVRTYLSPPSTSKLCLIWIAPPDDPDPSVHDKSLPDQLFDHVPSIQQVQGEEQQEHNYESAQSNRVHPRLMIL